MASTSIIADVARNVAGDAADVESLMPLGADPHIFQPTPGDVAALAETDVVFVNGMNFEEGLMPVIENADDDINIQVVSQCVNILAFGGHSHDHDHAEGEDHDHAEGEDHDHAEGEDHDHA
ncbi:MAG: metal ABC transporter solute-binding protein, Zn/Mn family, partial [Anaerolineales bacterium]